MPRAGRGLGLVLAAGLAGLAGCTASAQSPAKGTPAKGTPEQGRPAKGTPARSAAASGRRRPARHLVHQAPGTVRGFHLEVGGKRRSVLVYLPRPAPSKAMPLVLVYHGADDTAANAVHETDMNAVADARGILVAYPQGYDDTWNEGAGHTPAERAGVNDVAFTRALVGFLEARYRIDAAKVGATGFSNGALMVEDLGCHLAGTLALIVPVEGELPVSVARTCRVARPIDVFEIHGTADQAIPYGGGPFAGVGGGTTVLSAPASAARWAALDHCTKTAPRRRSGAVSLAVHTGCAKGVTVTLETIAGGTHDWPNNLGQVVASALLGTS